MTSKRKLSDQGDGCPKNGTQNRTDNPNSDTNLDFDESAYLMYHRAETGCSCLSFDILRDSLGNERLEFPHQCYVVAGTQMSITHSNMIILMKMSNLRKTYKERKDDESSDEDSDDEEENLPQMETATIKHNDVVNRLRVTDINGTMHCATWSANGTVYIWNLATICNVIDNSDLLNSYIQGEKTSEPVFTFSGHLLEGYGLDWSPLIPGSLLTGDCKKNIHRWTLTEDGSWIVDQNPFIGHSESVEDIQWSPKESNVFSSCSVDKSIRIWDTRERARSACKLVVRDSHTSDVNVLNWNNKEPFLVSGGDDGVVKIWDLRFFEDPVAIFKYHSGPITSVEWHPTDSSVFAASSDDDKLTLWDLAVEADFEQSKNDDELKDIPPQLLFVHEGQSNIKELHWHPQIAGLVVSTALNGFNFFKTISV